MVDFGDNQSKHRWVCPSDRHLALRAKLRTGWSVKTQQLQGLNRTQEPALDEAEQAVILDVIRRAEQVDKNEEERVGRLVDRLDNLKRNVVGSGGKECVLCGAAFGILGAKINICHDCRKTICSKCCIETTSTQKEQIWLCKICSETREMWKKSGAWFFKGLPKYVLPEKSSTPWHRCTGSERRQHPLLRTATLTEKGNYADTEDSSSDDELMRRSRANTAGSIAGGTTPNAGLSSAKPTTGFSRSTSETNNAASTTAERAESTQRNSWSRPDRTSIISLSGNGERIPLRPPLIPTVDSPVSSTHEGGSGGEPQSREEFVTMASRPATPTPLSSSAFSSRYGQASASRSDSEVAPLHGREVDLRNDLMVQVSSSMSTASTAVGRAGAASEVATRSRTDSDYLGTVEVRILFDAHAGSLHCHLIRAKDLTPTDINGLADPFCKLNLLPVGPKPQRLRTRTMHKTVNPEFNETLAFYAVSRLDITTKSLHILFLDDDKYGCDFLGEAKIPLASLRHQQARLFTVNLGKHHPGAWKTVFVNLFSETGFIYVHRSYFTLQLPCLQRRLEDSVEDEDVVWGDDVWARGQILVTLCYSTRRRALIVGIVRCVNLAPMDSNGLSDPFVKLQLRPSPHTRKYKTSVKWRNLNPLFNEEFIFDTKVTELQRQTLSVTVWDRDYGKNNDYLGGLELSCMSKGERLRHWIDTIKFPDHKHEGWHHLTDEPIL